VFLRSRAEDEAAGDDVVESLLFFGDACEDEADAEGDEFGDESGEVAARGASEGDTIAFKIGHDKIHYFFSDCALPLGAFKVRVIEPTGQYACADEQCDRGCKGDDGGWVGLAIASHGLQGGAEAAEQKGGNENCA